MEFRQWIDNELSEQIWNDKYRNNNETFEQWLDRVSGGYADIRQLILDKKFLFGGRILASRGLQNERKVTYSNCYVLEPVGDSIEDIYETAKKLARTFSYGGGCGIDISNLRPKGSAVNNAARTTSGAVSFMDTFSSVSEVIGQQGRRGALMISMSCDHPDAEDFINAKKNSDKLQGCNISVRCNDMFMTEANMKGTRASDLFYKLAHNNWDYAEPGILYWDTIRQYNMLSEYIKNNEFDFAGVNPCAEEPLPAGGSCLLGAINLAEFVDEPFGEKPVFNVVAFRKAVGIAVRALNNVLDEGLELHPLQEQRDSVTNWRQIGLGIMGFGDMLIKMRIEYGSTRSLDLISTIGKYMVEAGLLESTELAKELGAFPMFDADRVINSNFIKNLNLSSSVIDKIRKDGLRNSQLFTIAPTGSIGTMLTISTGVEPLFNYAYTRTTKSLNGGVEKKYKVITPIVLEALKAENINSENVDNVEMPKYIVWSEIIHPYDRIAVQGQWQRFIDASISSTVNLPNNCTVEDVAALYYKAWEVGCKGLTIYRKGCKREGILNDIKEEPIQEKPVKAYDTSIDSCIAQGTQLITGCGSLWITCYFHKQTGQLCHIFLNKGSQGGCNSYMIGLSRMISLAGKKGASIDDIIEQLNSVQTCPAYNNRKREKGDASPGNCCPSAIGKAIKMLHERFLMLKDTVIEIDNKVVVDEQEQNKIDIQVKKGKCPECGTEMAMTGGCNICLNCGWSKCQ